MGLDTSHDCWHGAYSGFTRWRNAVARAAGYDVQPYQYPGGLIFDTPLVVTENSWAEENYSGTWERPPEDPLLILLVHSDCDGHIEPDHALFLAKRLEQLLPKIAEQPGPNGWRDYEADTRAFIDGLLAAHAAGERVDFH